LESNGHNLQITTKEKLAMARNGFPVPKDEENVGVGRLGQWIVSRFYGDTEPDVIKKRDAYFSKFPSKKYDTHTLTMNRHPDGYYKVVIRRWSNSK
jgi:hypothetical protein